MLTSGARANVERRTSAFNALKAAHSATRGATGWRTLVDWSSGAQYWHNDATGASQWESP